MTQKQLSAKDLTPEGNVAIRVTSLCLRQAIIHDVQHRNGFGTYEKTFLEVEPLDDEHADMVVRGEITGGPKGDYAAYFEADVAFDDETGSYEEAVWISLFEKGKPDGIRYKLNVPQPGENDAIHIEHSSKSKLSEIPAMKPMKGYREIPSIEEALRGVQEAEE